MIKETDVLVVGGGPAGLLAAIGAARAGARVVLAEKNKQIGRKLRITGKGRCNVTNAGDIQSFIRQYGGQGAFLFGAFSRFFHQDICRLLGEAGVETKVERGGRIFPASDRASDVAEALERLAEDAGVEILTGCKVRRLMLAPAARVEGVKLDDPWDESEIRAKAIIVATGGASYPATGSTGDGYAWAKAAGHRIAAIRPALAPLYSPDRWVSELSGLTLKNVKVSLWANKAVKLAAFQGEMMFAHFGLTGPVILSLSRYFTHDSQSSLAVRIDLKPALSHEVLDKRIQRDFLKYQKKQLGNAMGDLLPKALIPAVKSFAPDPAKKARYDRVFAVYKELYGANRKLFRRLQG
jgi:predicted Rossmann fold flavoprotein